MLHPERKSPALDARPDVSALYDKSVELLEISLAKLKATVTGPAAATDREKHALLATHGQALQGFQVAVAAFTVSGAALDQKVLVQRHANVLARIHPYLLESPFARRCFEKPLGYPGDYVMVRHILNDPFQGDSAFAQLVNFALLQTAVAQGHRNRIVFLEALLERQAKAAASNGRRAVGLTIGCGPAEETFRFVTSSSHADSLALTLLDFDQETLDWTRARLADACASTGKAPELTYLKESVYELAKKNMATIEPTMDFVVCAGLFDYLKDGFCKRVIEFGMRSLAPGGTLLVTNVSLNADTFSQAELLEWSLIYRSAEHLESLIPALPGFSAVVYADATGTNVVAEVTRK